MNFTHPEAVESLIYQLKQADFPRGDNRSKINDLLNGFPPYSDEEVESGNIAINVPSLAATRIAHEARMQFTTAFINPDPLFSVDVDIDPVFKSKGWSMDIQQGLNKTIKQSLPYMETRRNIFAQLIGHGISPSSWIDKYSWCPSADGIEDILVPSNTLLDLSNLPFIAKYRQFTGAQLWKMTHGVKVDPAWNIPLVERMVTWIDGQAKNLIGNNWPDIWSPEKMSERVKQDSGLYSHDSIPTIDCYEFLYWSDEEKKSGWRRKIILDAWGNPGMSSVKKSAPDKTKYGLSGTRTEFLYDSGERVFATKLNQSIHFQFADCSSVAPFRYHSVRSLGFLLYSVCHLQDRLLCKFNEATFESLMQYFRVNNMPDAERALKVDLTDKKALPDGLQFVTPQERWQVNESLVQMAMNVNKQTMDENSSSYTQDLASETASNETATRTMAKANASSALISGILNQAYTYQKFQYDEICRRFCKANSKDPDVRKFRNNMLKTGMPEEVLDFERWDVQPVRVIGSGNKMIQMAMMDKIMLFYYSKLDPSAQRDVLRMGMAITTDDYALAQRAVPEQPHISDSVHDAQLAAGTMLMGLPMDLKEGVNHSEYIERLLLAMHTKVQQITNRGGVGTPDELTGLQNIAGQTIQGKPLGNNGVFSHILILESELQHPHIKNQAQNDKQLKTQIKGYADALAKLMNEVRAFAQRAQETAQQQKQAGGGLDPKDAAKVAGMTLQAKTKAQLAKESHAQRTAQRQITFEQKTKQDAQKHQADIAAKDLETASNIKRGAILPSQSKKAKE